MPVNLPTSGTLVKLNVCFVHMIRNVPESTISRQWFEPSIAWKTAAEQMNLIEGNRNSSNYFGQLFHGIVGYRRKNIRLSAPASVAGDNDETFTAIGVQLVCMRQAYIAGVKPEHTKPPGRFAEHVIHDEALFRRCRVHLASSSLISRSPAGMGA